MKKYLGASIIAGMVFFLLNVMSSLWLDADNPRGLVVFFEALIKTAVFVLIFHYLHNLAARLLRWYGDDEDDLDDEDVPL